MNGAKSVLGWAVVLGLVVACGDKDGEGDGSGSADGTTGSGGTDSASDDTGGTGGQTSGAEQCGDTMEDMFFYPPPGDCYNNAGCASCNCLTFQDNPPSPDAMCVESEGDAMRVTATLWTFPEQDPVPMQTVRILNATDVGILGPENAPLVAEAMSDADGHIDVQVTPNDQIGIVAVVQAEGYRDTATGLAKPPYEPSNAIHDLFVVPETTLQSWSDALAAEGGLDTYLPLGDEGGVVGIARNRYTGEPVAGVEIVSLTNGADTGAIVRYLGEDGASFTADATSSTGIYVLLNPALAEEFEAVMDGQVVSTRANKAGSGPPGIFTMNLTIDTDPGFDPFAG